MRVWVDVFAKYAGIHRERAMAVISDWIIERKDSPPNLRPFMDDNFPWLCVLTENIPKATLLARKGTDPVPDALRKVRHPEYHATFP